MFLRLRQWLVTFPSRSASPFSMSASEPRLNPSLRLLLSSLISIASDFSRTRGCARLARFNDIAADYGPQRVWETISYPLPPSCHLRSFVYISFSTCGCFDTRILDNSSTLDGISSPFY
ncbi:hypothetical protein BC827DRAFT_505893 [Russula dissimulans]|nr:hypothetical protein BC827DRAFT_505893 [Russula dissimulans]